MKDQEIKPDKAGGLKGEPETLIAVDKNGEAINASQKKKNSTATSSQKPKKKNEEDLIRVDKNGDIISNFFTNFYRQLKNPSSFNIFRVTEFAPLASEVPPKGKIDKDQPSAESERSSYNDNQSKNHKTMENKPQTENQEYRYTSEQIDWKTFEKLGLSKDKLEKLNALDPLLRGFKTNTLVPVTIQLGSAVSKMDVRLSLQPSDTGGVSVQLHAIRREPNLNLKFLGHEFSDDDKKNLLENGNMGRVVDLVNPKTDEIIPSIISRDRLTNELVAYRGGVYEDPRGDQGHSTRRPSKADPVGRKASLP